MKTYSLSDFGHITSAKLLVSSAITVDALPTIDEVKTLAVWNSDMLGLFEVTREQSQAPASGDGEKPFDRSGALSRMAYYGAESGWTDSQIMVVLLHLDDKWEKYTARRDRENRYIIPMINRARQKIGYNPNVSLDIKELMREKSSASAEDTRLIWGAQDFVDADFPIKWTYEGLLPQKGLGLIVADPGTGKTQLALHMASHMSLGLESWLKWDLVGGKRKVMFVSLEMGAASLHLFMEQIAETYDDRRVWNKNLLLMPLGKPLPLDTPTAQAFLSNVLDEYMPDVVIIDSFQAAVSKEMSDEISMKNFFAYLAEVREKYSCSMILIHHNRKRTNEAKKSGDVTLDDVYGSRFISAALDFALSMRESSPNVLTIDTLKCRLGKRQEPFEIVRDKNLAFSVELSNIQEMFGQEDEDFRNNHTFGI